MFQSFVTIHPQLLTPSQLLVFQLVAMPDIASNSGG